MLKDLLVEYVNDSNNPSICYQFAAAYKDVKQYAAAITYFIRASELTKDIKLSYDSILNVALCFKEQGARRFTLKNMLLRAVSIDPTRPEAYYLLAEWYEQEEHEGKYFESYANINLVLSLFDKDKKYLIDIASNDILYKKADYANMCNLYYESQELLTDLLSNSEGELKKNVLLKLMSIKDKSESNKANTLEYTDVHTTGFVSYALKHGGSIHSLPICDFFPNMKTITNPSISIVDNKILVNARFTNYILYYSNRCPNKNGPVDYLSPDQDRSLKTENIIFELDDNMDINSIKPVNMKLNKDPNWHFIGLEDARLIEWENEIYLCGVRRDALGDGQGRMELTKLKQELDGFDEVERITMPAPGPNNSYCEKNWMPIVEQPFNFVKWTNPTEIVEFLPKTKQTNTIVLDESKRYEFPRDPRGGSQVLKWNDEFYIAITHESIYNTNDNGRNYIQRIIVWDKDWNVVNWTQDFTMMLGQIEFVSGMCFHNDDVLISFGYEDNSAFVLKIPKTAFDAFVIGG